MRENLQMCMSGSRPAMSLRGPAGVKRTGSTANRSEITMIMIFGG